VSEVWQFGDRFPIANSKTDGGGTSFRGRSTAITSAVSRGNVSKWLAIVDLLVENRVKSYLSAYSSVDRASVFGTGVECPKALFYVQIRTFVSIPQNLF